jgi:hypothetical protein
MTSLSEFNVHTMWNSTILWWEQVTYRHWAFTGRGSYGRHISSITVVQKVLVLHTKAILSIRIIPWGAKISPWNILETHMHWVFQKHYLKIQCLKVLSCGNHDGRHRIQVHVPTMKFSKKHRFWRVSNSSYLVSCSFQEHCHANKTSY